MARDCYAWDRGRRSHFLCFVLGTVSRHWIHWCRFPSQCINAPGMGWPSHWKCSVNQKTLSRKATCFVCWVVFVCVCLSKPSRIGSGSSFFFFKLKSLLIVAPFFLEVFLRRKKKSMYSKSALNSSLCDIMFMEGNEAWTKRFYVSFNCYEWVEFALRQVTA